MSNLEIALNHMSIMTIKINSFKELQSKVSTTHAKYVIQKNKIIDPNNVIWWRGQAKATDDLQPSIYRNKKHGREARLFHEFRMNAKIRHNTCPDETDYKSWLFLMQHYGLPTRLLDWSESLLIALFFVCNKKEHEKKSGALWGLKPIKLNEYQTKQQIIFREDMLEVKKLVKDATTDKHNDKHNDKHDDKHDDKKSRYILAVYPFHFDMRHYVQLARFTIHGQKKPLDQIDDAEKFLLKFVISPKAKKEIKNVLKFLKITEDFIYPDLEHLSSHLSASET